MQRSVMPNITIAFAAALIVLGVLSYLVSSFASWTALIPALLGVLLLACGVTALRKQKLGVHLALVVALLGVAGTAMNVLKLGELFAGTAERPLAVAASTITFALLVVYLALGIRSFVTARRWRDDASARDTGAIPQRQAR